VLTKKKKKNEKNYDTDKVLPRALWNFENSSLNTEVVKRFPRKTVFIAMLFKLFCKTESTRAAAYKIGLLCADNSGDAYFVVPFKPEFLKDHKYALLESIMYVSLKWQFVLNTRLYNNMFLSIV